MHRSILTLVAAALLLSVSACNSKSNAFADDNMSRIARIDVRSYGAKGDGGADDTAAVQKALDAAAESHGVAVVPAGTFRCGSLNLKSNTTLRLEAGATLQGITGDVALYPVIESTWFAPGSKVYSAVLQSVDAHDVKIVGEGTIDGSGEWWWKNYLKSEVGRPCLMQFLRCKNVTIEGVHLVNSPGWNIHPVFSSDIMIQGVNIKAPPESKNTDGIDPNSCQNVRIIGCTINVGDDCIAIKSGAGVPVEMRQPTENVVIKDCLMLRGHGGVTIGSETSGSVRNVRVSNCKFEGTDNGIRMKSRRGRGGVDEDIVCDGIEMKDVKSPIHMTLFYFAKGESKDFKPVDDGTPTMRNITLRNIRAVGAERIAFIEGLPERPITDLKLENVHISASSGPEITQLSNFQCTNVIFDVASAGSTTKPAKP